jgi:hypothetical protein
VSDDVRPASQDDSWLRLFRELYDPQSATRLRDEDERFGRKLVSLGLVTEEQLREGLAIQERLSPADGPPPRLASVLIERGVLSRDRLARTLVGRVASDPANRLGPFVLFERLDPLRAAATWRAWDGRRRSWVRLVSLEREHADAGRFLREAGALLRLAHPNLLRALEGGEADGRVYVAFEWIKAGTLETARVRRKIWTAVRDAARGLQAAHEAGLSHGALERSHVFLAEGGAKLLLAGGVTSSPAADVEALRAFLGEAASSLPPAPTAAALAEAVERFLLPGTMS